MRVIGYTYDADYHCESCTLNYAREVPYHEFDWSQNDPEDEDFHYQPGIWNLPALIEREVIRDSEGNPIRPVFNTDEWYANDIYEGNDSATLNCSDCGAEMAKWEAWD